MNCIAGGTQALHTVPQLVCGNPCRPAHGTGGGSGLSGAGTSAAGGGPCCIYLFHLPPRVSVSAEGQSKLLISIQKSKHSCPRRHSCTTRKPTMSCRYRALHGIPKATTRLVGKTPPWFEHTMMLAEDLGQEQATFGGLQAWQVQPQLGRLDPLA